MPAGFKDWHKAVDADIVAQTLDTIKTDIVAQTVSEIKTDIVAQTIATLNIDVKAQSVAELVTFWKVGKCYANRLGWSLAPGQDAVALNVYGKGVLFFFHVDVDSATGSENVLMEIEADDNVISGYVPFMLWNSFGFDRNTPPWRLLQYAAGGYISGAFSPAIPLTFDSHLRLIVHNGDTNAHSGSYWYIYTLL